MEFTVTAQWMKKHSTLSGGWTRRQLAQIGVSWPPPIGWQDESVGKQITDEQRRVFEAFGREQK